MYAALTISHLELDIVEIVHWMLGDIEDAHAHIHRSVEDQTALVHLGRRKIIIKDVRSGKGRAGDKASELFFACANQLYVYALAKVFHRLSKDAVVHELVDVFLEVAGSPISELCVHPDVGLYPGALSEAEGPVNLCETHAQREVELQDTVVKHVTGLVAEVRYQLFNLS